MAGRNSMDLNLASLRGILDFFWWCTWLFYRSKKYLHAMINEELKYPCMFFLLKSGS
jgi:hypothetical protein